MMAIPQVHKFSVKPV